MKNDPFTVSEVTLNVARGRDEGPPLLLIHGVVRRGSDFAPMFSALGPRWYVHAVDLRGHGESGRVPGRYRVVHYVQDLVELLERHFGEPVVVYGHSLGAMVALGVAAAASDRVRGVVLEDPPFHTMGTRIAGTAFHSQFSGLRTIVRPGRTVEELLSDLQQMPITLPDRGVAVPFGTLRDSVSLRYMASCLARLDPQVLEPIVAGEWLDGYDWLAAARGLKCPTLLLQADGAVGGMLTAEDAAQFVTLAPHTHLVSVPGVGHLMHWLAPEITLRNTLAFLESLR